jgi:hypothetical protein
MDEPMNFAAPDADNRPMRLLPETPPPDSTEIVAGNVLGALVIFLLLQVPVMILFLVLAVLLPELGIVSRTLGSWLGIAGVLVGEGILIISLVRMVRRRIGPRPRSVSLASATEESSEFERRLERLIILAALAGVVCSLLMGLGSSGARVALTVIEAFAVIFLVVVIATRWFVTRRVSTAALLALAATLLSVGFAMGLIRR